MQQRRFASDFMSSMSDCLLEEQAQQQGAQQEDKALAGRLQQVEQHLSCLAQTALNLKECMESALSKTHGLEDELTSQLDNVREDTKQAITIATSRLQANCQRDAAARVEDAQQQLQQQLEVLRGRCDSQLTSCQLLLGASATAELDIRLAAAQQMTEERLTSIQSQLDQGSRHTDVAAFLERYAQQVTDVFEQLASSVTANAQASIAELAHQHKQSTVDSSIREYKRLEEERWEKALADEGLVGALVRQLDGVHMQLQAKADRVNVEEQLLVLQQQLEGLVPRQELQKLLMEKLDIREALSLLPLQPGKRCRLIEAQQGRMCYCDNSSARSSACL
eukprot:gene8990-9162_t